MLDIDREAIEISKENAILNGMEGIRMYESDGFRNMFEMVQEQT